MFDFQQRMPYLPLARREFDVETEMAEQDESAREAQRNLLIAIAVVGTLTVVTVLSGLPGGTALFGTMVVILSVAVVVITLVRRSIHRNFGTR